MKRQLHPGAKWQFRIRGYFGAFFLAIFLSWMVVPMLSIILRLAGISIGTIFAAVLIGAIVFVAFVIIVSEIYARMSYKRWFYEFTDEQLRLERGIIWKRYSNLPYERVQNVDITRGIIARMLGFSTVMIQTAGYSYTPKGGIATEGYIPAVSAAEAEHIREFLMKKISRRGRSQGL
jgi:putative membrane protein